MESRIILFVFIALYAARFVMEQLLVLLNCSHVRQNEGTIPPAFAGRMDEAAYRTSARYALEKGRFSFWVSLWEAACLTAVLGLGLPGILDGWVGRIAPGGHWASLLFIGIVAVAEAIVSLPASLWSEFVIERRFGFSTMTPRLYVLDAVKDAAVSLIVGVPLLLGLFFFLDRTGASWWLWAFALFAAVELVLQFLYPLVIAPLFNRFAPLAEGEARTAIMELARRLSFPLEGVYVMDASKRSRHSNAYFTGFGRSRRVVLYDTLLKELAPAELAAVLAHEIGHWKKRHILKGLILSLALSCAFFFLLGIMVGWPELYGAFGFGHASYHAFLFIVGIAAGPVTFWLTPLLNAWSRRHEYAADRFAVEALGGDARPLIEALAKLDVGNASNLSPHPAYSFFHYSHPAPLERFSALQSPGKGNKT